MRRSAGSLFARVLARGAVPLGGRGTIAGLLAAGRVPTSAATTALATQTRMMGHAALRNSATRELEEEQNRTDRPECPPIPSGWEIKRDSGKYMWEMTRKFQDEQLRLLFTSREDMEEGDNKEAISFVVLVNKNNKTMWFDLSVENGELVLDNVAFFEDAAVANDRSVAGIAKRDELYPGPKFNELDGDLVDSFIAYLEERGVNDALGEFVVMYSFWVEQVEYENWLKCISAFAA